MTLKPSFFSVFLEHKTKTIWFALLVLATTVVAPVLGYADLFVSNSFAVDSLMQTTFGFYTFSTVIVFSLYLLMIFTQEALTLLDVITHPDKNHEEVSGIKYMDLPAIPNEADMFNYVSKINRRILRKDGRLHVSTLKRYKIDDYGNLMN